MTAESAATILVMRIVPWQFHSATQDPPDTFYPAECTAPPSRGTTSLAPLPTQSLCQVPQREATQLQAPLQPLHERSTEVPAFVGQVRHPTCATSHSALPIPPPRRYMADQDEVLWQV